MSEWVDHAAILRLGHFREADLWLKMLCKKHGLFTIFAFGGAKSKKRFCGCLDVFNSLECRVKISRNGEFLNLQEAVLLSAPRNLRNNWRGMGVAANCLRFVEALRINPESSAECFALVEDLRAALESETGLCRALPYYFRLRAVSAVGFAPNFRICGACAEPFRGSAFFLVEDGQAYCQACAGKLPSEQRRRGLNLPINALRHLYFVQNSLPTAWRDNNLNREELRACSNVIDSFVQYHVGIVWRNNGFSQIET